MAGLRRAIERWGVGSPGLLLLVVLVFGIGIWSLSAGARREIDALATANADSTQWSLAQSEVEFLRLRAAILRAAQGEPATLRDIRRTFDVFYSRVQTIKTSPNFADVRRMPEVAASLASIDGFLAGGIPLIDGPDDALVAALGRMEVESAALSGDLRTISLAGVEVFAARSETQRERVAATLTELAAVSFLLFVVIIGFAAVLVRLLQSSRARADRIEGQESRLRAIATTSLDAILVVDRDGRVVDYNGAAQKIFGYAPDEAIGRDMAEMIVPEVHRAAHAAGMRRHRETGEARVVGKGQVHLEAKDKDGRVFPVELSIATAETPDGPIYVSFIRDISNRLAAQRDLIAARDQALAGEKAKAELLAMMSHEMRTPLNGILGTLQLLEATPLDDRQKGLAEVMETSGRMLLRHVNAVLDISRSDAGMQRMARDCFDPVATANEIVGALSAQAAARGNRLEMRLGGPAPGPSLGDEDLIRQVLTNLVGNAIKFTANGRITVEIERLADEDMVEFRVADTGIGIEESDLDRIFEDFVTLDSSYTRQVEGTGLGLGIVRRLVRLMQGEIGVESEPGEGSVFWVRLPLAPTSNGGSQKPGPERPTRIAPIDASVLLVEDNEINRLVARGMISELGCRLTEAHDGQDGVDRAAERRFDLILMDISMPRLDGVAATRLIRSGTGPNHDTPVIALTAHALPADMERFREAGMTDVVIKPIERERLASVLSRILRTRSPVAHPATRLETGLSPEIIAAARGEIATALASLQERIADCADPAALRPDIHRLVGIAAVLGETELRQALAEAETVAATGDLPMVEKSLGKAVAAFRPIHP